MPLLLLKIHKKISVSNLNKKSQEKIFLIDHIYGDLKEKMLRISHIGDYTV